MSCGTEIMHAPTPFSKRGRLNPLVAQCSHSEHTLGFPQRSVGLQIQIWASGEEVVLAGCDACAAAFSPCLCLFLAPGPVS